MTACYGALELTKVFENEFWTIELYAHQIVTSARIGAWSAQHVLWTATRMQCLILAH